MAYRTPASLPDSAVMAICVLRRSAIRRAHWTMGSCGRFRQSDHAACPSTCRTGPDLDDAGALSRLPRAPFAGIKLQIERLGASKAGDVVDRGDETKRREGTGTRHADQQLGRRLGLEQLDHLGFEIGELCAECFDGDEHGLDVMG